MEWSMRNMKFDMDEKTLHIAIDIADGLIAQSPPSSSGASRLVASTHGFMILPGDKGLKLSFNLTADNHK